MRFFNASGLQMEDNSGVYAPDDVDDQLVVS